MSGQVPRNGGQWRSDGRVVLLVAVWAAALYAAVAVSSSGRSPKPRASRYFSKWDSVHYLAIAGSGYEWSDDGRMHNPAFFPLYPLAIRAAARSTGINPSAAGEIISFAALVAASLLLVRLARLEGFGGFDSVAAMLAFPAAFFFLCVYSESLFLVTAAACLLASREDRPGRAFVFGALAALTRVNGVLLVVPLAWSWWTEGRAWRRLLVSLGPATGLAAVSVFDAVEFGRPFAWFTVQQTGWHHALTWPWRTIARGLFWNPRAYFSVVATAIFCVLTILLWKSQRAYALWIAANLALFLTSGSMLSTGRLLAPLFPVFWPVGRASESSRLFQAAWITAGAAGLFYSAIRFSHGGWSG